MNTEGANNFRIWSPLIVSVASMLIAYGAFANKITNLENSNTDLKTQVNALQTQISQQMMPTITEIAALKAEQAAQQREASELRDVISRRFDRIELKLDAPNHR